MLKLKKIALTGSLACGKSSACHFFKECGAFVVSADEIVHQVLSLDNVITNKILNLLGPNILDEHKQFDRQKIAHYVFNNSALLKKYEALLHPVVRKEIELKYTQAVDEKASLFLAEIPLLFETEMDREYDATIVVNTPQILCIQRFIKNTEHSEHTYHQRMNYQMSSEQKLSKATYILRNHETLEYLKKQVNKLFQQLKSF